MEIGATVAGVLAENLVSSVAQYREGLMGAERKAYVEIRGNVQF
jgi:hypothetical protein